MGLGNRSARRHQTTAAASAGANPEEYWDFQPGQKVMTKDGFQGTVAAVTDGPIAGTETYLVELTAGLGGGEYSASQLQAVSDSTGKVHRTAADDYPELGNVLVDRPDIAPNTVLASKRAAASNPYGIETTQGSEPNDGADSGVDEHGHLSWGGHAPGCGDSDEYSMFGENDAVEKHAAAEGTDPLDTSQCVSYKTDPSFCLWHKTDHLDRHTGEPRGDLDGHLNPMDSHSIDVPRCDLCGGLHDSLNHYSQTETGDHYQEPDPDDSQWVHMDHTDEPGTEYRASLQTQAGWSQASASDDYFVRQMAEIGKPGYCAGCGTASPEHAQTGESHQAWAERKHAEGTHDAWGRPLMQPYDGHGAWNCNNYSCTEHPQSMYPQEGQVQGTPGWLEHDTDPNADLRQQINQAMPRQDTEDANWLLSQQTQGPSKHSALNPQDQCSHPSWNLHGQCKQCGYTAFTDADEPCDEPWCVENEPEHTKGEHIDPPHLDPGHPDYHSAEQAIRDAFGGEDHSWLLDQQHQGPSKYSAFDPWAMLTTAATDPDFRFEVTAAWSDVRAKAKRIRSEGGVHVTMASDGLVMAEVKGDHHVYETGLQRMPGRQAIHTWSCGCKWGAYHWGADDDFSRFAGRMCSHALALQYEAQSRGMFGKDIVADDSKPSWVPRRVVVKYDIDDGRNVSAPATSRSDFGRAASLSLGETALGDLLVHAFRTGEGADETLIAFAAAGIDLRANPKMAPLDPARVDVAAMHRWAAVNNAWGEPDPAPRANIPGPTKPRDFNENPASAGWATGADPDSWQQAGPSGLDHMVSSLSDDTLFYEASAEEGAEAELHEHPEAALPATDGADGDSGLYGSAGDIGSAEGLEPEDEGFVSTGSVQDIVAQFQAKAAHLQGGGSSQGSSDIAAAARAFLETGQKPAEGSMGKTALKDFTPAEQAQIINEGENVRAANLDRLEIAGTHYEPLEAALAAAEDDDEGWMS